MGPVEITSIIVAGVSIITGIGFPLYLRQKRLNEAADTNTVVSWQSITKEIGKERDRLRIELDGIEAEHRRKFREMQEELERELAEANKKIRQLEGEVAQLSIRLYRTPPPPQIQ